MENAAQHTRGEAESEVTRFHQNLRAQAELYRVLLHLVRKQSEEISNGHIEAFLGILDEKRKIIAEIGDIELATIPLREFCENHKSDISEGSRNELRLIVNEIRGLLEQLLELELQSQEKLGIAKDLAEEQLNQLALGSRAAHSYKRRREPAPRFMDEVG